MHDIVLCVGHELREWETMFAVVFVRCLGWFVARQTLKNKCQSQCGRGDPGLEFDAHDNDDMRKCHPQ